jgi:hypothetical protein
MDERNQRAIEREAERRRRRATEPAPRWRRWARRAVRMFFWLRVIWLAGLWVAGVTALFQHLWVAATADLVLAAVFTAMLGLHWPLAHRRT